MERTGPDGNPSENPPEFLEPQLTDGVVRDAVFLERIEPDSQAHVQETPDEDDSFLSIGTETWEYEIADGREKEFEDALRNSRMVIDYQRMDEDIAS